MSATIMSATMSATIMSAALAGQLHRLPLPIGTVIAPAAKRAQARAFQAHLEKIMGRSYRTCGRAFRAARRARTDWVQDCRVW